MKESQSEALKRFLDGMNDDEKIKQIPFVEGMFLIYFRTPAVAENRYIYLFGCKMVTSERRPKFKKEFGSSIERRMAVEKEITSLVNKKEAKEMIEKIEKDVRCKKIVEAMKIANDAAKFAEKFLNVSPESMKFMKKLLKVPHFHPRARNEPHIKQWWLAGRSFTKIYFDDMKHQTESEKEKLEIDEIKRKIEEAEGFHQYHINCTNNTPPIGLKKPRRFPRCFSGAQSNQVCGNHKDCPHAKICTNFKMKKRIPERLPRCYYCNSYNTQAPHISRCGNHKCDRSKSCANWKRGKINLEFKKKLVEKLEKLEIIESITVNNIRCTRHTYKKDVNDTFFRCSKEETPFITIFSTKSKTLHDAAVEVANFIMSH